MANEAGVQYLGDSGSDGTSLSKAATAKTSVYGVTPVVQASAIAAHESGGSITTALNALITVVRNFGLIAAS